MGALIPSWGLHPQNLMASQRSLPTHHLRASTWELGVFPLRGSSLHLTTAHGGGGVRAGGQTLSGQGTPACWGPPPLQDGTNRTQTGRLLGHH